MNPNNFGGTFTFTGALVPTLDANNNPITTQPVFVDSIERYRRTLLFSSAPFNFSPQEVRRRGGCPSQFNICSGNPGPSGSQGDLGVYALADCRYRPNLPLNFGLRFDDHTDVSSKFSFAPRLDVAW